MHDERTIALIKVYFHSSYIFVGVKLVTYLDVILFILGTIPSSNQLGNEGGWRRRGEGDHWNHRSKKLKGTWWEEGYKRKIFGT